MENKPKQKKRRQQKNKRNAKAITQGPARKQNVAIPRVVAEPVGSLVISNLKINAVLDPTALQLPFISFYSHLCQLGSISQLANGSNDPAPYSTVASAVKYFFGAITNMISSGTVAPPKVPIVFRDITAALLPKTISTRSGATISYGWQYQDQFPLTPYTVGGFPWLFVEPLTDVGTYNTPAAAVDPAPDQLNYNKVMALMDPARHKFLRIVDNECAQSKLASSVSAFARNYIYNGLQAANGNTSGFYKDVELEVPIYHPYMAQFTGYGSDFRAPRYITLGSGDACVPYALPQHAGWGGYSNQGHVIYKFIDFENIYDTLALWAVRCKESLISSNDAGLDSSVYSNTFSFTQQDFRICLRQALLGFFGENYWTQFQGPLASDVDYNWFQPFYVTGNTFGSSKFAAFQLPELIRENLAALKHRVINVSRRYKVHVVPVLGRYKADIPSSYTVPVVKIQDGQKVIEEMALFDQTLVQTSINLTDGSISNGYVNLNGQYYANVLSDWNTFCGGANRVSTPIVALGGDGGPSGLVALSMTRQLQDPSFMPTKNITPPTLQYDTRFSKRESVTKSPQLAPPPPRPLQIKLRVSNYQKAIGNELGAIPSSSSSKLTSVALTSIKPMTSEELSFLTNLIMPTIRLDEASDQVLGIAKYQTEVGEFASVQLNQANLNVVNMTQPSSVLQTWQTLAGYCVLGAGGHCGEYARIMSILSDTGNAGFLANILGGIAKNILPSEAHGVVDAVAGLIPI